MMNCRNCGMPLTGPKFEYCGTDYSEEMETKKPRLVWDENGLTLYADDGMSLPQMTLTANEWSCKMAPETRVQWDLLNGEVLWTS